MLSPALGKYSAKSGRNAVGVGCWAGRPGGVTVDMGRLSLWDVGNVENYKFGELRLGGCGLLTVIVRILSLWDFGNVENYKFGELRLGGYEFLTVIVGILALWDFGNVENCR